MPREEELVTEFARLVNSTLVQYIPRDRMIQVAEIHKKTVVEYAPDSPQAAQYQALAECVMTNTHLTVPTPIDIDALESLALEFMQV
jgi:nitrogenase iron protein NifH